MRPARCYHQQTKLILPIAGLVIAVAQTSFAQAPYRKGGRLVTVVPGIRDEASNVWMTLAATLSPTTEKWVIHEAGDPKYAGAKKKGLSEVPDDHIIVIPNGATKEQVKTAIKAITNTADATVVVDMNLENRVTKDGWTPHTKWASTVSQTLAEGHSSQFGKAENLYIGHSAGTEPMAMMPKTMHVGKNDRKLYDDIVLLSGRQDPASTKYPAWAVLAFADGDFFANAGGTVDRGTIVKTYNESSAIVMAKSGYRVVRIVGDGTQDWVNVARDVVGFNIGPYVGVASIALGRADAHRKVTEITREVTSVYYEPTTAVPHPLVKMPLVQGLKLATDNAAGRAPDIKKAIETLHAAQPTEGIGGISLNATAYVPFEPKDIESAGYDENRTAIFLRLKTGKKILLPAMASETLSQTYKIVYVSGLRPELSIGYSRATAPDGSVISNLQEAGKNSIYYFGNSKDTLLGLTMFHADHMLGQLAFTNSENVREVARTIPEFRSLVEIFPEKYTNHPDQINFVGSDGRIYLTPKTVLLVKSTEDGKLDFGDFGVSIHFGQTGPAESAYVAFFESHFSEILKTKSGKAFADLIPFARASAIFHWLKENKIDFLAGTLADIEVPQVFTPTSIEEKKGIDLADVEVALPNVFYGLNGPVRIVRKDGRESQIEYDNNLARRVKRFDGQELSVIRDQNRTPVAVRWGSDRGIAFVPDPKLGLIMVKNISLKFGEYGPEITYKPNSVRFPIVNPETIVTQYVLRFAYGEVNP